MSASAVVSPGSQIKRLYISPLDNALFASTILPKLIQTPENVSFHTIPTFPEKSYGYLDLLPDEANSLQKRLNGSILRGMKIRVEDARPDKKRKARELERSDATRQNEQADNYPSKKSKKKERDVIHGVELPKGRHVKRGWHESSSSLKRGKNEKEGMEAAANGEMVFRTRIMPNRSSHVSSTHRSTKGGKKKQDGNHLGAEVEVKEFSNQRKFMSFLRDTSVGASGKKVAAFEEKKGWIDEDGAALDDAPPSQRDKPKASTSTNEAAREDDLSSSSGLSDESSIVSSDSDSGSGQMSDSKSSAKGSEASELSVQPNHSILEQKSGEALDVSSTMQDNSVRSLSQVNTGAVEDTPKKGVHPLEALFKRPTHHPSSVDKDLKASKTLPLPAPIKTGFTFFGLDDGDEDDEAGGEEGDVANPVTLPQTPFTRRDLEGRAIRSAAPTPDTAAIGGRFAVNWPRPDDDKEGNRREDSASLLDPDGMSVSSNDIGDDGNGDNEATPVFSKNRNPEQSQKKQSTFEANFWEQRGEFNRSWKDRKHEARKEVRRRENRRSARVDSRRRGN